MGRKTSSLIKILKAKKKALGNKIHIEDYIDILEKRKEMFEIADHLLESLHMQPNMLFKQLSINNKKYLSEFKTKWNKNIIDAFCDIENIYSIIQR
jgi:hypothetical protein